MCCIHLSLEDSKHEDACLAMFPSLLTVFQSPLLNTHYQETSGKSWCRRRGWGEAGMDQSPDGCFPSHTLWIPGAGDPRELGIFTGCICSGGRTLSLELATEVPPGISTLISGLKTPLTLAGGVLIGLPVLTFMCLFCCFCFKAAASAAHELPWFLGREKTNC